MAPFLYGLHCLIGPIASNWAPCLRGNKLELSTLGCSSTHNNTLQVLQRTSLGPAPPKDGPALLHWTSNTISYNKFNGTYVIFFLEYDDDLNERILP